MIRPVCNDTTQSSPLVRSPAAGSTASERCASELVRNGEEFAQASQVLLLDGCTGSLSYPSRSSVHTDHSAPGDTPLLGQSINTQQHTTACIAAAHLGLHMSPHSCTPRPPPPGGTCHFLPASQSSPFTSLSWAESRTSLPACPSSILVGEPHCCCGNIRGELVWPPMLP